jgi:3-hydroxymyristoyl/3-hydroxydecanoyl-(acyl carrier protein) dehydratase
MLTSPSEWFYIMATDRDMMSFSEAASVLPQLPPFRLIDRVLSADLERGELVAERMLTSDDALWPAEAGALTVIEPIFPAVLIIEALCQAAACVNGLELLKSSSQATTAHLGYLVAISDFRFPGYDESSALAAPRIGETLRLHVERQGHPGQGHLGKFVSFAAHASVLRPPPAAVQVASGQLLFAIQPK